jgi:hypothetical protein
VELVDRGADLSHGRQELRRGDQPLEHGLRNGRVDVGEHVLVHRARRAGDASVRERGQEEPDHLRSF